jgi:hypothetical protein
MDLGSHVEGRFASSDALVLFAPAGRLLRDFHVDGDVELYGRNP